MSRISKLMRRERESIAHALSKVNECPWSFAAGDVERLHELIQDEWVVDHLDGDELAVNNYQALCVSSYRVPFIDVDTQARSPLQRLQTDLGNAGLGGRVYRTRKGYRMALYQELSAETLFGEILPSHRLEQYGVDPTYALFCRELGNYRARVSAKPWRLVRRQYSQLSRYERWGKYPVIQFVENFGNAIATSQHWQTVMNCHDATAHCITNRLHTLY